MKETIKFLSSNKVPLNAGRLGGSLNVKASWKGLDTPDNFKFTLDHWPVQPWWGKCSLTSIEKDNKTRLTIIILPPYFFLFFIGLMAVLFVYAITTFGIANYGTSGFLPSIIVPTFFTSLVVLAWFLMWKSSSMKIRSSIVESFRKQFDEEKIGYF